MMYALVDCNCFYASCERVFRPELKGRPVVVLSNNDGCLIALSTEAKALGYKMGDAFFKVRHSLQNQQVAVFSSNYALYGDMSARVMKVLEAFSPDIEVYSIDEAFLSLRGFQGLDALGHKIKYDVERLTGVPVSVGIAPTKTLAKLANHVAKRFEGQNGSYVMAIPDPEILKQINVSKVWGIGRNLTKQLETFGVFTAQSLSEMDPRLIRKRFSVVAERTVRELQGICCIPLEDAPPHPQNIMVSRGFKTRVKSRQEMEEAVSFYANRSSEKARQKKVFANAVHVFIRTDPYGDKDKSYKAGLHVTLNEARNDAGSIITAALTALRQIYKPEYNYQKAGVMLTGLVYDHERQRSFFNGGQNENTVKLMEVMDKINRIHGRETIRPASAGSNKTWFMAREYLSPCYTTRWSDLRKVIG
ncbi:Y-family DNA polymerase [Paremcibacter congregatus]|uniref:Y-family DNA polymerase n=1 Tax=Paremcibacter congregatus TaxID=2043170 RepID=UPI0030EC404B|tara:strand:+ start:4221 stop:5474 length:1254 start_codon:yes stop_codon:yes gene_type:complete